MSDSENKKTRTSPAKYYAVKIVADGFDFVDNKSYESVDDATGAIEQIAQTANIGDQFAVAKVWPPLTVAKSIVRG